MVVQFIEREQEKSVMFGDREQSSTSDMLTEYGKEDGGNPTVVSGVIRESFSWANYRNSIKKSSQH